MKKVSFGFSNSMNPTGSFEGIGFGMVEGSKAIGPTQGELIDVINIGDENYLVTKVTMAFGNDPRFLDKVVARRALADVYADGSAILYVDQTPNNQSVMIEQILNNPTNAARLASGMEACDLCGGRKASFAFECALRRDIQSVDASVTAITHEAFEKKNNLINRCHSSVSDMMGTIMENSENYQR